MLIAKHGDQIHHDHDQRGHHDRHGLYHGHDHRGHRARHGLYHGHDHRGHHDRHGHHGHCGHALRTMHPPYRKAVRFPLDQETLPH